MDGKTADGTEVKIENYPVMTYFKRSGFRPAREAIERLGRNTLMTEVVFELTTKRNKMGSVTYFTPVFTQKDTVAMDDDTMETMSMFLETVKASNANILEQHKEASKAKASEQEVDLAADFN
jgi:dsDNA-binding SOS-regulon protein